MPIRKNNISGKIGDKIHFQSKLNAEIFQVNSLPGVLLISAVRFSNFSPKFCASLSSFFSNFLMAIQALGRVVCSFATTNSMAIWARKTNNDAFLEISSCSLFRQGVLWPNSILTPARVGNNKILLTKDRRENYLVRIKVAAS